MSTQADVDALTQQVSGLQANLTADVTNIQNEITALQSQPGANVLDLSGLTAAVSSLSTTVDTAGQIAPPATP